MFSYNVEALFQRQMKLVKRLRVTGTSATCFSFISNFQSPPPRFQPAPPFLSLSFSLFASKKIELFKKKSKREMIKRFINNNGTIKLSRLFFGFCGPLFKNDQIATSKN
jgi:hypothetical protein